jgi:hypothetical protein
LDSSRWRSGLDWTPADGGEADGDQQSEHAYGSMYGEDLIGLLQPMAERPMAINSRSMNTVAIYGEDFIGLQLMGTRCHASCTTDVMSLHKPMAARGWLHALHKFENRFRHRWVSVRACAGLEIKHVARCTTDFRRERGKQ